jgi:uncharacterized membrane protein YukC
MGEIIAKLKKGVIGDKESWLHTLGHSWRILLILALAFILYRAFSPNKTNVTVGKGGTAIINQAYKRFLIPFVEGYIDQKNDSKMNTGIRAGIRFEF